MTRAAILALACLLAGCSDPAPKVLVQIQRELPTSPSPDLLVQPAPVVTAGSKDVGEALARMKVGLLERDRILAGWLLWWAAARASVEKPAR